MNYLAHLYLASDHPEAAVGSLMGDFVKGSIDHKYPRVMRAAIAQHRAIDSFTDAHPIVLRSKSRIEPPFRRYAGILADMIYDHFLATEWSRYARSELPDFIADCYRQIDTHFHWLPERMHRTARYMIDYDLLGSYTSMKGIERALRGIETRLSRPSRLGDATLELSRLLEPLREDFHDFFPDLIAYVDTTDYACGRITGSDYRHRYFSSDILPTDREHP